MADVYDEASGKIDENKRAMLAAMAQSGTAGAAAYQQAQAEIAAQQQAAVQAALGGAAQYLASPQQRSQMEATIGAPYQRYQADLSAAQAYGAQSRANQEAANSAYFEQAKAAIPALRTYSQAAAAERAAKDSLEQRRLALSERELELREQEMNSGGAGGSFIASLNKQFGGAAGGSRALLAEAKNYVTSQGGTWGKKGTTALLAKFDQELGLPSGYTRALLPKKGEVKASTANDAKARSVGISAPTAKKIRGYKEYKAISLAVGEWSKEMRRAEFVAAVNSSASLKNKPLTRQLLIAEYAPLFTTGRPKK